MSRLLAPVLAPVLAITAASSCETGPAFVTALCSGKGVAIEASFPAAGRHSCTFGPDGSAVVSVDHEPALVEGINPSPWYAFRIRSDKAHAMTVTLDYTDYTHRYAPVTSSDGKTWTVLPADHVSLNDRKTRATLQIDAPAGALWVAAQPISSSYDGLNITRVALFNANFSEMKYGTSKQGRPLKGFVGGGSIDAIVVITRQHPPETTGQEAYRGFLERLVSRSDQPAVYFRARNRIILAPMPNPDGVDGGHWRLNAGGMDLNRDWGKFTQPETKALSTWIQAQAGTRRVVAFMDFHSTDRSVIYAPPLTSASPTIGFLTALKTKLDTLPKPPEWSYSHNAEGGTSKGWALEALKAPGITVELGDQIPIAEARALGAAVADEVIDYFTR